MPTIMTTKNLDDYYHSTSKHIVLNQLKYIEVDASKLSEALYTKYNEEISLIPSCEQGCTKGAWKLGKLCPVCGTEITNEFNNIDSVLWIEKFSNDLPLLNPYYWGKFRKLFKNNIDGVRWLTDTTYNPPGIPPILFNLAGLMNGRGYKKFIDNIPRILTHLKNNSIFRYNNKLGKIEALLKEYKKDKDKLFSRYVSLPNKRLFVMEMTNKGNYTSSMLADVIDVALYSIKLASLDPNTKKVENGVGNILSKLSILPETYIREKLAKKPGIIRKNIYGTRSHFTFRCVISSLPSYKDYDTIEVPWKILCSAFRPHVLNKLLKMGYKYKDANALIYKSISKYDPVIDAIGKELIAENKEKGIPVLFHRNPSLKQGSIQLVYITKFKSNMDDETISASMLIIKSPNGDLSYIQ